MHGEADRQQREFGVLGEVVADHREAGGVAGIVVVETRVGVVFARDTGLGARGRARVLRVHREALLPRWSGPRIGMPVPARAVACLRLVALSVRQATALESSPVRHIHSRE
ncbi:hypothetical protein ALMP_30720 [Streptomyces sp. A012304]|nr:hypothetical protein ALMP_30720 [Streptomyces sp. A012304]